ncbi:MAG: type II CRISPR RNA-guided endonuclease Cas9 [Paludibacteraceae bacterium]|nr:type II CRISPR RNA-guided endonuclease Cas9 [Paludibacteraceae bacterium]
MKKVLGLDLGVGSVGWSLIETTDEGVPVSILGMGSRIVPLTQDDSDEFSAGQAISKNAKRTTKRTARKGYDRYQQRRYSLTQALREKGMLPEAMNQNVFELWKLRADAATEGVRLTPQQIGRVLCHINQKRGYRHSRQDVSDDTKQTQYVKEVNSRYDELRATGLTIGQFFYAGLQRGRVDSEHGSYSTFRIKDRVYPRQAHEEEFDHIMQVQRRFWPELLTDEFVSRLRDRIIFYQRPLRSCKHLVSMCEFEMKEYTLSDGRTVESGPKVAPRTSPLAQICKIWESVNNLTITNRHNEEYELTLKERQKLVDFLDNNETLTTKDLYDLLNLSKADGWYAGKAIGRGLQGNTTKTALRKALDGMPDADRLLQFDLHTEHSNLVDELTGENLLVISSDMEHEPLYRLWHAVYSLSDRREFEAALKKQFGIDDTEVIDRLWQLDFVKPGYANKSARFMRRLLPYLQEGMMYSEACEYVGKNHSDSMTRDENLTRTLDSRLEHLQKNELHQPVVEKILNQMINVVNALMERHGQIDEICVELARELKQSRSERKKTDEDMRKNEKENKQISGRIRELGIQPTRRRIQKYRMWEESNHKCIYCDKIVDLTDFLKAVDAEREHIIPRSVLFDNSFSNMACACRKCNQEKADLTGYDYMQTREKQELEAYVERVHDLFKKKAISSTKHNHLLWKKTDIPDDFIARQLRQTQYISRKALEILKRVCREVYATSGSVTDFLRHEWGYDDVLHQLNLPRYKDAGLTEMVTYESNGVSQQKERIHDWSKRLDHRHHAVDALTIALTRRSYIQRLNTLSASRDEMKDELKPGAEYKVKKSLLQKWIDAQPHFPVSEVKQKVDGILVSFRAGKRVTTPGKRAVYGRGKRDTVQTGILVPRGALSEDHIYGKRGDDYVIKYPLNKIKAKNVEKIIDGRIRRLVKERLEQYNNNKKEAFAQPLYSDEAQTMQIRTVRCKARVKSAVPVRRDADGNPVGFVNPGNNHHVALYRDSRGKYHEMVVTFWNAVDRKRFGLPAVITDPSEAWTMAINHDLPQSILDSLPGDDWTYVLSMQQDEMFILGMSEEAYQDAMSSHDYSTLNKHLYRVQKISSNFYVFRHHIETSVDDKYDGKKDEKLSMQMKKFIRAASIDALLRQNPHKVSINVLGEITEL